MRTLFFKLFLAQVVTLAVALVVFALLLSNAFESTYARLAQQSIAAQAQAMAEALAPAVKAGRSREDLRQLVQVMEKSTHTQVCLVLPGGESEVVGTGRGRPGGRAGPGAQQVEPGTGTMITGRSALACGETMVAGAAQLPGGLGLVQVRAPYSAVVQIYVSRLRRLVAYAGCVAVVVAALVALLLAERVSVPLRKMRGLAARMAEGDFASRLGLRGKDEISALGRSFDLLADSLQQTLGQLRREQAHLRGVLASIAEGIIAVDSGGRLALMNPQAAELLGLAPRMRLGTPLEELDLPAGVAEALRGCLRDSRPHQTELRAGQPERVLALRAAPMQVGAGGALEAGSAETGEEERGWGAVAVLRDVTEARRLEEMRRRFVSDVSHEIRTPLTAIGGFAAAIAEGVAQTEEERVRAAGMIVREVERLNRLASDLLDLSRIESGAVELDLRPVDMGELIRESVASFEAELRARGILVELDLPADLPPARGDADRLHQVMANLMSNAIRFNRPQGKIRVSARGRDGWVEVEVADTGIGIPEEELPHIWERFHRVDPSRAREGSEQDQTAGTGLGLAIVRSIVAAHGGAVSARSVVGEGSAFSFTVPAAA